MILIEGAMEEEITYFLSILEESEKKIIAGYEFYEGKIKNKRVVISKTLVGTLNATIATTIAILNYEISMVINQGIAGSHCLDLHIGDIVIGETCRNVNAYKMPIKEKGEGSNSLEWKLNKRALEIKKADTKLVTIFEENLFSSGKIVKGTLGSGDVFNREYDRIMWLQETFQNLSEDMESIGCYTVCEKFLIPCIGIRVISNNELLGESIDKRVALELQKNVAAVLEVL